MNVCRSLPYVSSVLGAIAGRYYISQRDNHRNLFAGVLLLSPAAIANEVADEQGIGHHYERDDFRSQFRSRPLQVNRLE